VTRPARPTRRARRSRRATPLLALLLLLLAAGPLTAPRAAAQDDGLAAEFAEIEAETAEIRGLPPKTEIREGFLDREALRADLEADLAAEYPPADLAADELFLKTMGLVPPDLDLRAFYLDLYTEQVGGFYDPETDELYVIAGDDDLNASEEIIYAHEVTHALQDQYFDLLTLREPYAGDDDALLAVTALIEGDATAVMTDYLAQNPGLLFGMLGDLFGPAVASETFDSAPPIIAQSLLFPYEAGLEFVIAVRGDDGGYGPVDAAFRDLPTTTEQILHPEKYLAAERDVPVAVTLPDLAPALGPGWERLDETTLGEFGARVLLTEHDGETAAAGWDGDRYALWSDGTGAVVAWQTAWDSDAEAEEFAAALRAYDESRFGAAFATQGNVSSLNGDGVAVRIVRAGDRVAYVLAPSAAAADVAIATVAGV
jgi:hypothetical protein